ncbi:hypothetical protein RJD40_21660 (plasmid) [Vibrio scophthalmi]|uniref:hypothetical protein n=1 Tax=Vibrio scophthalmi TaxID=45658 RepID=UPI003AB02B0D
MRWVVLLAVFAGIIATINWSYHQLDQAFLVTSYWEATEDLPAWGLVNFQEEKPTAYAFNGSHGYWPIFKGLWPVWALFSIILLILIPLSHYIYNGLNDVQITTAKKAQRTAEEQAEKRIKEIQFTAKQEQALADKRIASAYAEANSHVRAELEQETQRLHLFKNELVQREQSIRRKEVEAQRIHTNAENQIAEIQHRYAEELKRFESETRELTKARDNAQGGYQRLKRKKTDRK